MCHERDQTAFHLHDPGRTGVGMAVRSLFSNFAGLDFVGDFSASGLADGEPVGPGQAERCVFYR